MASSVPRRSVSCTARSACIRGSCSAAVRTRVTATTAAPPSPSASARNTALPAGRGAAKTASRTGAGIEGSRRPTKCAGSAATLSSCATASKDVPPSSLSRAASAALRAACVPCSRIIVATIPSRTAASEGERRIGEHQLLQRRRGAQGRRTRALEEARHVARLQVVLLRERVEIGARLCGFRLQLLLNFAEAIGCTVATQLRLEFATRLVEGFALAGLDLIEAADVIAELRLHGTLDLAHRHGVQRIRERRDKAAALRPAEIPAVVRGSGVLGVLLRQLAKVLARLRLCQDLLRLGESCGVVLAGNENVPRVPFLGHFEPALVLL